MSFRTSAATRTAARSNGLFSAVFYGAGKREGRRDGASEAILGMRV